MLVIIVLPVKHARRAADNLLGKTMDINPSRFTKEKIFNPNRGIMQGKWLEI